MPATNKTKCLIDKIASNNGYGQKTGLIIVTITSKTKFISFFTPLHKPTHIALLKVDYEVYVEGSLRHRFFANILQH